MAGELLPVCGEQLLLNLLRLCAVEITEVGHERDVEVTDFEPSYASAPTEDVENKTYTLSYRCASPRKARCSTMPAPVNPVLSLNQAWLKPVMLCLLMVLMPVSTVVQHPYSPPPTSSQATYFLPGVNETGVNVTNNGMLSIPSNRTFSGGELALTPLWTPTNDATTAFGIDEGTGWQGAHSGTHGLGGGGQLSLAPASKIASLTNFETLIETLPDWEGQGIDHGAWNVHHFPSTSIQAGPANATLGQRALATQAYGGLQANMTGCLASPMWDIPSFVSRFNLSFDHWMSFKDSDAAWVEWRSASGTWTTLTPTAGYSNNSLMTGSPGAVWAGDMDAWHQVHFSLDSSIGAASTPYQIRFCFLTSHDVGHREGWFIDNLTITNQGDLPGAWFHGNMTGDYAHNAAGRLQLKANVSGFTGPLELEFWANWDMEGAYADNLLVLLSVSNGTSWAPISGIPGIPGNGLSYQGTYYTDESQGWIPVSYSLPSGVASHQNASEMLIEFFVYTDQQTGYGGFASSGWEGIFIDEVAIYHQRGTAQEHVIPLANFTANSSNTFGDPSGWLAYSPPQENQWEWTTNESMHGPEYTVHSFENTMSTPPGWTVEGDVVGGWEIGQTRNTSGYGPGVFHSGLNGAAINLTTRYTNNIYTHLVTEEYTIPQNASARLSFQSWVCAEANWDGGAISISTDSGQTWWWLPPDTNSFHDQISTVNTNSPLYGEGIIDGSQQPNGCTTNRQRPFELKTYDLSNLSGQSVKARFSFFSDTYVEADGWYIDDAGIEVDVFEPSGTWTSSPVVPDPLFGYGVLDAWYEQPEGTSLSVDVLDVHQQPIPGHQGLSFPAALAIDPLEHPLIHLRVAMATNDTFVTPRIHSLSVGQTVFIGPHHITSSQQGTNTVYIDSNGSLVVTAPFSHPIQPRLTCPYDGYRLTTVGDNLTLTSSVGQLVASSHRSNPKKTTTMNYSLSGDLDTASNLMLSGTGGEVFERAKVVFDCARPAQSPKLSLGLNNASVFDWPLNGMSPEFGINTAWTNVSTNTTEVLWSDEQSAPALSLANETLEVHYTRLARSSNPGAGPSATFLFLVNNATASSSVTIDGLPYPFTAPSSVIVHQTTGACPTLVSTTSFSTNFSEQTCRISLDVAGEMDIRLAEFAQLLGEKSVEIDLSPAVLNEAKDASKTEDHREVLNIPLHINTTQGGLRLAIAATSLPMMVESVDLPAHQRWLPGEHVSFTTHHLRNNPLDLAQDAPDIEQIELFLSRTRYLADAFAHVQVDQVQQSVRFRQLQGAGLAQFDAANSSVTCSMNACSATWFFSSTWLLDDVFDLHILTQATDTDGLAAGPVVFVDRTPFNEVENDMEVIDFAVVDDDQRRLDDWTNSFWPYHLQDNTSMTAQGRVRLEGIAGKWIEAGQAEATVTMTAVPPKNLSGGPDEWQNGAVNWTRTWSAEVGEEGWFSINISMPSTDDNIPSNTWMELLPSLTRRGPTNVDASSSEDKTVVLTPTRVLFDTVLPSVIDLDILDAGLEVPADGYVAMLGRTLALRLHLSDSEGLDSQLEVWTWKEAVDDVNGNGEMEATEYTLQTVSLNRGVTSLEVDLPLMASEDVVPNNAFEGRLSVVLRGQDLAGNPLQGGGEFGESSDLATVLVQRRSDTTVDLQTVSLDRVGGHLLPGHLHELSFVLSDANTIESLDALHVALFGEIDPLNCFIHYAPRFGEVTYDEGCFLEQPSVIVSVRPLTTIYDVQVKFRMNWTTSQTVALNGGVPSIQVFDEGQDLGLGLFQLSSISWTPSVDLALRWLNITDATLPVGDANETTRWYHRNDLVHHELGVFHNNTNILARDVPGPGFFVWELTDGERSSSSTFNLTSSGHLMLNVSISENVMYNDTGVFSVRSEGFDVHSINGLSYEVVVDDRAPKVVLSPGALDRLDSNALDNVTVTVSINDDADMPPTGLTMHAVYYRMGEPIEGSKRVSVLPVSEVVNEFTVYHGSVNLQPANVELTRSDILIVWFEATDRSGRPLTGFGTAAAPLNVAMTWVAFEPVFTDISATPYRPKIGENVSVYARVANNGLLAGEMTVVLRDDEGGVLANETLVLNTSEWANFAWNIEAWKTGRLGLSLEIVNYTPVIPVPLADIQANDGDGSSSSMAMLSLSALSLLIASIVLFMVRQQRAQRDESYHLERIRRIVSHRLPPPVPLEILEAHQEE